MTREEAKEWPPIIQAWTEGKTIQDWTNDTWKDKEYTSFGELSQSPIKHQPKYRPFNTKEECWQEMQKHHPFGWVIDKLENFQHLALVYSGDSNSCDSDNGDRVGLSVAAVSFDFEQMLKELKFADGTPFGIREE